MRARVQLKRWRGEWRRVEKRNVEGGMEARYN